MLVSNRSTYGFLILFLILKFSCQDKYTNLKCYELDPGFATFQECRLRLVRRGTNALNIYVKLFKIPVDNITVNFSLWRKYSGYRLFMYNETKDFCKFMKQTKKLSFMIIIRNMIETLSNINHTCPYNHDIIVRNQVFDTSFLKLMPLPIGEYRFDLNIAAYNDWKAKVEVFIERSEEGQTSQLH